MISCAICKCRLLQIYHYKFQISELYRIRYADLVVIFHLPYALLINIIGIAQSSTINRVVVVLIAHVVVNEHFNLILTFWVSSEAQSYLQDKKNKITFFRLHNSFLNSVMHCYTVSPLLHLVHAF
jgi:hypothetical protein